MSNEVVTCRLIISQAIEGLRAVLEQNKKVRKLY